MSGFEMAQMAYQDGLDRPLNCAIFQGDVLAGSNACTAILAALIERGRSGLGQHVGATLLDSVLAMLPREVQEAQLPPAPRRHLYRALVCNDGYVLVMPLTAKNFAALCEVIGQPALRHDPRFVSPTDRAAHWEALMAMVEDWTMPRTADACEQAFLAAGLPAARYRTIREVMADPRFTGRDAMTAMAGSAEPYQVSNTPFTLSATPPRAAGWAATLGEHDAEIRALADS
jgi:CoA:oxalate CoA-transferase